jgi:hypothetical protein
MSLYFKKLKIEKDFTFPLCFVGRNPMEHRSGVAGQPFSCARGPSLADHRPSKAHPAKHHTQLPA